MTTIDIFKHAKEHVSFSAGETLFKMGDPGDTMYVVHEGEVDIFIVGTLLETVGPGGLVGEMALIDKAHRSATAVAKTDCTLVPVDETRFKMYVHHTPFFAIQVMRIMADRLRRTNEMLNQ